MFSYGIYSWYLFASLDLHSQTQIVPLTPACIWHSNSSSRVTLGNLLHIPAFCHLLPHFQHKSFECLLSWPGLDCKCTLWCGTIWDWNWKEYGHGNPLHIIVAEMQNKTCFSWRGTRFYCAPFLVCVPVTFEIKQCIFTGSVWLFLRIYICLFISVYLNVRCAHV